LGVLRFGGLEVAGIEDMEVIITVGDTREYEGLMEIEWRYIGLSFILVTSTLLMFDKSRGLVSTRRHSSKHFTPRLASYVSRPVLIPNVSA
jgi:hypothetical protein